MEEARNREAAAEMNLHYGSLITALRAQGIRAEFQRPHQLALPTRVWLTWNKQWYICTWTPAYYSVPADVDVAALCQECLACKGSPFYVIPDEILGRHRLLRLESEEFDRVC